MKNNLIVGFLLLTLAVFLGGCSKETTPVIESIPVVVNDYSVIADGILVPVKNIAVGFSMSGTVEEIFVNEGDKVEKDDLLASMKNHESYQANIEAAKLELVLAENAREALFDSSEIAYIKAWQQMLNAKENVNHSQSTLDLFDESDFSDRLAEAKASVIEAEKDVKDAQKDFEAYEEFDEDNATRKNYKQTLDNAKQKLNNEKSILTIIENEYAQLKINLIETKTILTQVTDNMNELKSGPKESELKAIKAQIRLAKAQIASAETMLDELNIMAPFDGTIMQINFSESEFVLGGTPVFILADLSSWIVETDDLTEFDVVKIKIGQAVKLELEAYPDTILSGTVEKIDQVFLLKEGDVTYTTTITINDISDLPLQWGMSMIVIFE